MDAKQEMRARTLASRARRGVTDLDAAGAALCAHVERTWTDLTCVAAHVGVGTEPPTRLLLDRLLAAGCRVLLPVVDGADLDWSPYAGGSRLTVGAFGLLEPTDPPVGPEALAAADLVVVPAMAVDRQGHRLGRGGGYYDRALAGAHPPVVAVVYDDEVVDAVPAEPHDVLVDALLTPSGLLAVTRPGAASVPGAVPVAG